MDKQRINFPDKTQSKKPSACRKVDCSQMNRQRKRNLSQNREELGGFAPDFKGSEAVFQINTLKILELDILSNSLFNICSGMKLLTIQAFCSESSEKVFHSRVVIRAAMAGHRRFKVIFLT